MIALDHIHGTPKPGAGYGRGGELGPPDVALCGLYHSVSCRILRAADETKVFLDLPSFSTTLFIAAVTSSGACRARYSDRASE